MLMMLEGRERVDELRNQLRLALVSYDPKHWLPRVFPVALGTPTNQPEVQATEEDLDLDTPGDWRFTDTTPAAEAAALLEQLMAEEATGTMTLTDRENEWR